MNPYARLNRGLESGGLIDRQLVGPAVLRGSEQTIGLNREASKLRVGVGMIGRCRMEEKNEEY